jgi:hypothetical protein
MSKLYTTTSAVVVILLFAGMTLFLLVGTLASLWFGDFWLAFCRGIGFFVMLGITCLCLEAWETK